MCFMFVLICALLTVLRFVSGCCDVVSVWDVVIYVLSVMRVVEVFLYGQYVCFVLSVVC